MNQDTDPTLPMRQMASEFPEVDEGTACSQSSFKTGGKAFFFVGEQGGRYKCMVKLDQSRAEAEALAAQHPSDYQVGKGVWVTFRFSEAEPLPAERWRRWLAESYELSRPAN